MIKISFLAEAAEELRAATEYYNSQAPGLGRDFVLEVQRLSERIAEYPEIGSQIRPRIHRRALRRFPLRHQVMVANTGSWCGHCGHWGVPTCAFAPDYLQRSTLYSYGSLIGGIGGALIGFAVYWVFFPTTDEFNPGLLNADGYLPFTLTAGVILIGAIALCVFGTAGQIPHLQMLESMTRLSFINIVRDIREVFRGRDFLVIFAGFMLWFLFGYTESVGMPFMNLHFWGLQTEELAYFGIVSLLGLPVAFALVPWITRTFDKRNTMIGSSLVYLILPNIPICLRLLEVPWYPDNSSPWILYITLAVAFVNAGSGTIAAVTYSSIYADLSDAHEFRTHQRREGAIFAARSFSGKAAGAFGLMIGGAILDLIAFPKNAPFGAVPDEVIWNLGLFVGPATSIFSAAGVGLFLFYRLDKARHAEIARALEARRAN